MQSQDSQRLHRLEAAVKQQLTQHAFVLPTTVWCIVKRHALFIILDYTVAPQVDRQRCLQDIKRSLLTFIQQSPDALSKRRFQGQVHCYWRTLNDPAPIASYSFVYKDWLPTSGGNFSQAAEASGSEADAPETLPKNLNKPLPETLSKPSLKAVPNSEVLDAQQIEPASKTAPSSSFNRKLLSNVLGWNRAPNSAPSAFIKRVGGPGAKKYWKWSVGLSSVVAMAIVGLGGYAWSRPCVSDTCPILDEVEELQASLEISDSASVEDVAQTYTTLLDVNYQLSQVPFWSPHYTEAKTLLTTYENHAYQVSKILGAEQTAENASMAGQSPPYPLQDLKTLQQQWQQAIQILEPIAEETIVSPLAQTRIKEYDNHLQQVEQQITQERQALEKIQAARKSAQLADTQSTTATSLEQWQTATERWNTTLKLLDGVSAESMAYAEAEHLRAIYYPQMIEVQDRLKRETLAQKAYKDAIALAKKSVAFEQSQQWSSAIQNWQAAIEAMSQVAEDTSYYDQAMPLVTSYTAALSDAQQTNKRTIMLQQAQENLLAQCDKIADNLCQSVTYDSEIHVWLTAESNRVMESAILQPNPDTLQIRNTKTEDIPLSNSGATYGSELLRVISEIGKTIQIPIHIHNADRQLFGTYTPESSSYMPTSTIVENTETDEGGSEAENP